jgi:hypothetical protein
MFSVPAKDRLRQSVAETEGILQGEGGRWQPGKQTTTGPHAGMQAGGGKPRGLRVVPAGACEGCHAQHLVSSLSFKFHF